MKNSVLFCLVMAASSLSWGQKQLSLSDYMAAVEQGNTGLQGAKLRSEGAGLRSVEGYLMTSPQFFAQASQLVDQSEKAAPAFQGVKTENLSYSLGVSKLTTFGLAAKVSYSLSQTEIFGVNPALFPDSRFFETRAALELSQSLWKNGFGSETRATLAAAEASANSVKYQESFAFKMARAEAEMAYWKLSLARAAKAVQEDSLERARKIRDWNLKRFQNQLADKSDFLQADAAFKYRELECQQAIDEERAASRHFNSLRGVESDVVTETLTPMPSEISLGQIKRASKRDDVLATEEGLKAAQAQSKLGREKAKPNLDVFANYTQSGRDASQTPAVNESMGPARPITTVGLKFNMPFDFGTVIDVNDGYKKEEAASELKLQRKIFEQEEEWSQLNKKFDEAQKRLKLAYGFEEAQKQKYEQERLKQTRGRSTIFYVLQFEQDYALAQVNRLRIQTELLGLLAQLKTFGGAP